MRRQLDEATGQYYLHHFYAHQPDLNFGHPAVRQEIMKIMGFWLELGIDGFRIEGRCMEAVNRVGRQQGDVPFASVLEYVDDLVTVDEESLSQALLLLIERAKLVVEPAGAAAVAALMDHPDRFPTPSVAVLSGGNVDPLLLMKVIRHGLAAAPVAGIGDHLHRGEAPVAEAAHEVPAREDISRDRHPSGRHLPGSAGLRQAPAGL